MGLAKMQKKKLEINAANDVGEMSVEEINEYLKPQLKGYIND